MSDVDYEFGSAIASDGPLTLFEITTVYKDGSRSYRYYWRCWDCKMRMEERTAYRHEAEEQMYHHTHD